MPRGYDRPRYILPFDHRGPFQTRIFGWRSPLSDAQTAETAAEIARRYRQFADLFGRRDSSRFSVALSGVRPDHRASMEH
jgi:hypothetical protein